MRGRLGSGCAFKTCADLGLGGGQAIREDVFKDGSVPRGERRASDLAAQGGGADYGDCINDHGRFGAEE